MTAGFEPQLDKMAATLVLNGDLSCEMNIIALRLSTSHVVNLMNATVKNVFTINNLIGQKIEYTVAGSIQGDQLLSLVITTQGLISKASPLPPCIYSESNTNYRAKIPISNENQKLVATSKILSTCSGSSSPIIFDSNLLPTTRHTTMPWYLLVTLFILTTIRTYHLL
ncbi:unnamed protein product [Absidia cylindrospora]